MTWSSFFTKPYRTGVQTVYKKGPIQSGAYFRHGGEAHNKHIAVRLRCVYRQHCADPCYPLLCPSQFFWGYSDDTRPPTSIGIGSATPKFLGKGKGKGLSTCYSAAYTRVGQIPSPLPLPPPFPLPFPPSPSPALLFPSRPLEVSPVNAARDWGSAVSPPSRVWGVAQAESELGAFKS